MIISLRTKPTPAASIRKMAIPVQCHFQHLPVRGSWHLDRPKLNQMRCRPLRIQQCKSARPQTLHQGMERHLRGFGDRVEHRFTKEGTSNRDAVEASTEGSVAPRFYGMCIPQPVK